MKIGERVQASINKGMMNVCTYCGKDVVKKGEKHSCPECGELEVMECELCKKDYLANQACRNYTVYCLKCFMEN
jgi:predicted RNA-binding Zn-ribbon protein involved in translation (DUF1610 family)